MTISDLLVKTFEREGSNLLETHEFYDANQLVSKSSIRSALSRMTKKGLIERIDRGLYEIKELFKKFRHAKRIFDTHKKNPTHEFDIDLEITCEGLAPHYMTPEQVGDIVNPMLLDRSLEILNDEGIFLFEEIIDFNVIGTEDLGQTSLTYDNLWMVEVKMVNNVGSQYMFDGSMYVNESEW